jgi:hypothetical protein
MRNTKQYYTDGVCSEISCECGKRQKINKLLPLFRPKNVKLAWRQRCAGSIYKKSYVMNVTAVIQINEQHIKRNQN